jgi:hypothetical protein
MAGDPLRTLDIVAGRSMRGVFGGDVLPSAVLRKDPDSRFIVWTIVNYAWGLLAAATGVGLILVGVLARLAFGHEAGHVVSRSRSARASSAWRAARTRSGARTGTCRGCDVRASAPINAPTTPRGGTPSRATAPWRFSSRWGS